MRGGVSHIKYLSHLPPMKLFLVPAEKWKGDELHHREGSALQINQVGRQDKEQKISFGIKSYIHTVSETNTDNLSVPHVLHQHSPKYLLEGDHHFLTAWKAFLPFQKISIIKPVP